MARGRMVNHSISESRKFHLLPDDTCRLLATWIIPYLDFRGVFHGDAVMVKSSIFPRRGDVTNEQVESYLAAMEEVGLIYRFEAKNSVWQYWPSFINSQPSLRMDRELTSFPSPPGYIPPTKPPNLHWWAKLRQSIFKRDHHICRYCGAKAEHVDHVIPCVQHGSNDPENLVAACAPCNLSKGGRTPEQAGMRLADAPLS